MKKYLVFLAAALVQAGAWSATYTYADVPYTAAAITNYSSCTAGACGNFTAAMAQSGSFTTAAPLPANLNNADIASLITSFSFSDGLTQYNSADPDTTLVGAQASTNASGGVLAIELSFQHWADNSPHVLGSRMDVMILRLLARKNSQCQGVVFQSPSGRDVCQHVDFDAASSRVTLSAPGTPGRGLSRALAPWPPRPFPLWVIGRCCAWRVHWLAWVGGPPSAAGLSTVRAEPVEATACFGECRSHWNCSLSAVEAPRKASTSLS